VAKEDWPVGTIKFGRKKEKGSDESQGFVLNFASVNSIPRKM
jgi:hypothetical protein